MGQVIGDFNHRASLCKPVNTTNALGESVTAYQEYACVWCKIEYPKASSSEAFEGDQQTLVQRVIFVMRCRRDVNEKHIVQYRDNNYDILFIRDVETNKYIAVETELRR